MEAVRLPITEIATYLRQHLGKNTTAYISGVSDPKMVSRWIAGLNKPRDPAQLRMRESYQAARLLVTAYGDETAKAWFLGSNAHLDDQAPAYIVRQATNWEDMRFVVAAARAFARAHALD
jgi:hypothetical protein